MQLPVAFLRLGIAVLLGGAIGFERQWHLKQAGLRTNALVALGASGFVIFSAFVGQGDPTRVGAQVVTGIGFLGAGVILREGINVHGLNTAATLWCSAMVGTLVGGGFFLPGVIAAGCVMATHLLLRPLGGWLNRSTLTGDVETHYLIEVTCKATEEAQLRSLLLQTLSQAGLGLRRLESGDIPETSRVAVMAHALAPVRNDTALEQVVGRLSLEPYVSAATWQIDRVSPES
jgi:putative Mg2+ transporter-C (MgtC) family protein